MKNKNAATKVKGTFVAAFVEYFNDVRKWIVTLKA
jgi:hypothetical protein